MQTPSGAPCAFYYEDFARGAERQECRAPRVSGSARWRPTDCARCAVPSVLAANGSPYLELRIDIRPGIAGVGRRVRVSATCSLHGSIAGDPRVGCATCNADADALLRDALG